MESISKEEIFLHLVAKSVGIVEFYGVRNHSFNSFYAKYP